MNVLQKMGGVAALIEAATFVVGIALAFTILAPYATGGLDPGQTVAFLADDGAILYVWNLTIYVLFGVFLVVLVLALYEQLRKPARPRWRRRLPPSGLSGPAWSSPPA